MSEAALAQLQCQPLRAAHDRPLVAAEWQHYLSQIENHWRIEDNWLQADLHFDRYESLMLFVQCLGWMAQQQDHHPRLIVDYRSLTVQWRTHSINGFSINDFICAARCDRLYQDA